MAAAPLALMGYCTDPEFGLMPELRIAILGAAACLACAANAGVYIETQDSGVSANGQAPLHRMLIQDGAARIEHSRGDNAAKFVIFKDDELFLVDPSKKRYTVLDHESAHAIAGAVDSAVGQMRKELAKLKPEQRSMVEQMMGKKAEAVLGEPKPGPDIVIRDMGQDDIVNGVGCRSWEIRRDDKRSKELCVAPFSSVPGKEDLLALARQVRALLQDLTEALAHAGGSVEDLALMEQVQGFPVRIRRYDDSEMLQGEVQLKSWHAEVFPASSFDVPAGYVRRDLKTELTPR
jgi:hypothetical protein